MILEQNMIPTKEITKLQNRLSDLEEQFYSEAKLKVVEVSNKNSKISRTF